MGALYENILRLCTEHQIKPGKVCNDLNLSRGLMTDLKMGRKKGLSAETANKIATYFGVTVDYLLTGEENEKASVQKDGRIMSDDDIKFALFGTKEIDDNVLEQVKAFAKFARENRKD